MARRKPAVSSSRWKIKGAHLCCFPPNRRRRTPAHEATKAFAYSSSQLKLITLCVWSFEEIPLTSMGPQNHTSTVITHLPVHHQGQTIATTKLYLINTHYTTNANYWTGNESSWAEKGFSSRLVTYTQRAPFCTPHYRGYIFYFAWLENKLGECGVAYIQRMVIHHKEE